MTNPNLQNRLMPQINSAVSKTSLPAFLLALCAMALEYQVAPAGNSLADARTWVRANNSAMTEDLIITIHGGVYRLDTAFSLASSDGGTNGHTVIYQARAGEMPILTGGTPVSSWTLHNQSRNIWRAAVPPGFEFRQLYINGAPAIRARIPNRTSETDFGPYYKTRSSAGSTITIAASQIAHWAGLTGVEMVVQAHWYHDRFRVSSYTVDTAAASARIFFPPQASVSSHFQSKGASFFTGCSFHFENSYDLLDTAGEWFLDESASVVYYQPRAGTNPNSLRIVAPRVSCLLSIQGTAAKPVANLRFSGITFSDAGWIPSTTSLVATQAVRPIGTDPQPPGAIMISHATGITFLGNRIVRCGANGIDAAADFKNSRITGNSFDTIAANAIVIHSRANKSPADSEACSQVRIDNNRIINIGLGYTNGIGIVPYFVNTTTIEHNDIAFGPYMGIQTGGQAGDNIDVGCHDNLVRFNDIHDVMRLHDDGGGIYNLGRSTAMRITENWLHDIRKNASWTMPTSGYAVAGIYLDNYSELVTVDHNVFTRCLQNTYEQTQVGSKNNTWSNNATQDYQVICNAGIEAENSCTGECGTVNRAQAAAASASSIYGSAYAASNAVDNSLTTIWHTQSGGETASPWWKIDLGASYAVCRIEIVARQDQDQPVARSNFQVQGSLTSDFEKYTVLGSQGAALFSNMGTWVATPGESGLFRYIRVIKTVDLSMSFAEFRVYTENLPTSARDRLMPIDATPKALLSIRRLDQSGSVRIDFVVPALQGRTNRCICINMYDLQGRLSAKIIDGVYAPGSYHATWNASSAHVRNSSSGVRVVRALIDGKYSHIAKSW